MGARQRGLLALHGDHMAGRPQVPHDLGLVLRQALRGHEGDEGRHVRRLLRARLAQDVRRPPGRQQPAVAPVSMIYDGGFMARFVGARMLCVPRLLLVLGRVLGGGAAFGCIPSANRTIACTSLTTCTLDVSALVWAVSLPPLFDLVLTSCCAVCTSRPRVVWRVPCAVRGPVCPMVCAVMCSHIMYI